VTYAQGKRAVESKFIADPPVVLDPAGHPIRLLARASTEAGAVLALQRLVLPVTHWMNDNKAFGILRPRRRGEP
jgi:hypothetical protein